MSALTYIIFIVVALLASALGALGAYFYYRARHREAVAELQSLDQDLAEREEELHRLQYQFRNSLPGGAANIQTGAQPEIQKLREELEQKNNDYNILKQDFDLEIGILKQELEQLREEKSDVEHSRRHLARKDAELEERENALREKEADVRERSERLEAELSGQREQVEATIAAKREQLEAEMAERDRQLRARRVALEEEQEELERARKSVQEAQDRLDEEFMEMPAEKFTSRQEALLIKRLRQQIKLQRDELEQLQRLYHRTAKALQAASESAGSESRVAPHRAEQEPEDSGALAREAGDSFPSFSTLSSYMDRESSDARAFPSEAGEEYRPRGAYDDLTALPGLNRRTQQELYDMGVTSFDQIARWSSADVRRISERLEIDRKTIQDHWIISAQSYLFSRQKAE